MFRRRQERRYQAITDRRDALDADLPTRRQKLDAATAVLLTAIDSVSPLDQRRAMRDAWTTTAAAFSDYTSALRANAGLRETAEYHPDLAQRADAARSLAQAELITASTLDRYSKALAQMNTTRQNQVTDPTQRGAVEEAWTAVIREFLVISYTIADELPNF